MEYRRTLQLQGANCASCAYSIEHIGRKLKGVDEVKVDAASETVTVDFSEGDHQFQQQALHKIIEVVRKLGYEATITS
jgi:copper chaperone CopZ